MLLEQTEGRVARRQRRVREALVRAARIIMSEKGVDAATMLEIAGMADVGAGTIYNYFKSKDELAIAVLEEMMSNLGTRIEKVTNTFSDPAQVYAFGIRNVIETATQDVRWRQLLNRSRSSPAPFSGNSARSPSVIYGRRRKPAASRSTIRR